MKYPFAEQRTVNFEITEANNLASVIVFFVIVNVEVPDCHLDSRIK